VSELIRTSHPSGSRPAAERFWLSRAPGDRSPQKNLGTKSHPREAAYRLCGSSIAASRSNPWLACALGVSTCNAR